MEILFYFLAALSLLFSIIGVVNNNYLLLLICFVLAFPFSYSLGNSLGFSGFIFLPFFYLGSAVAVYKNNRSVAWLLLLPVFLLALFLLTITLIFA